MTGVNPKLVLGIILIILLAANFLYISHLQKNIAERDTHIVQLQSTLNTQNIGIIQAGTDKVNLETSLANVKISNGRLQSENQSLNDFIDQQVPAKDCNEALNRILNNAEELGKGWNK